MPLFYLVLDLVITIGLVVLAIAALLRNRHSVMNVVFAIFSASVGIWILANYISNDTHLAKPIILLADYSVFAFSCLASIALVWFTILLTEDKRALRIFRRLAPLYVLCTLVSLTPLVTRDVVLQQDVWAVKFGFGVVAYGLALVGSIVWSFVVTTTSLRRSRGEKRGMLKYYLSILYLSVLPSLILDFVVPAATGWFVITNIAILPMLILVAGMYYISIRHQLFDLRLVAVRATAYVLSLVAISFVYLVPIAYLAAHILGLQFGWVEFAVLALAGVGFSLLYHYGRVVFDRLTMSIFYRGYYSPQTVFNNISELLVRTVDLDELRRGVGSIIRQAIGARTIEFWLHDGREDDRLDAVEKLFGGVDAPNVIVLDDLDSHIHQTPKAVLMHENIAAIVRLRTIHGSMGCAVLGFKESGGVYTQQDKQLLSVAADEIAVGLQNALRFEEIQNFTVTLQEKVDKATGQLRRTNHRLRELDSTKDDFISMASHQLRTPLTSVKGYLSMVLEGDVGDLSDDQRKLLEQSYRSSQQMVYLISDLLNLSRLNTGKFVIEPVPVDLGEIVQFEVSQLAETAKSREIELIYDRPATFPTLLLDETKMHQVVMNFIDNAIYYTRAGGTVTVALRETPTAVEYTVKDNGIGVPKAVQHKLFSKFYRADNAQKARPDGTGLGLFMAKKVIAAQGGAIIFESEEGKGSTFGFRFSKRRHMAPGDAPAEATAAHK